MMPKLMVGLMIVFGIALMLGGAASKPFAEIEWSDRNHALMLVAITGVAAALYQRLGFILTMVLLVFTLLVVVERRNVLHAAAYSVGLTISPTGCSARRSKRRSNREYSGFDGRSL